MDTIIWTNFLKNIVRIARECKTVRVKYDKRFILDIKITDLLELEEGDKCEICSRKNRVRAIYEPKIGVMYLCYLCRKDYYAKLGHKLDSGESTEGGKD